MAQPPNDKSKNPNYVPYYPSSKYIEKNWAPEYVPLDALRSLAKAHISASKSGILSPNLASSLLPVALVEGRHDDFGLNWVGYPKSKRIDSAIAKMGMSLGDYKDPPGSEDWGDAQWDQWEAANPATNINADVLYLNDSKIPGYTVGVSSDDPIASLDANAKLAAVMLAEKANIYGEDKAIERWNGVGPGARNHARKVEVMRQMLNHKGNEKLLNAYKKMLREASK